MKYSFNTKKKISQLLKYSKEHDNQIIIIHILSTIKLKKNIGNINENIIKLFDVSNLKSEIYLQFQILCIA